MFDSLSFQDARPIAYLKKAILVFLAVFLIIGMVSTHRAYVQVRSLKLHTDPILHSGSDIQTTVVSSGRTPVDVQVELIQGTHSEMVGVQHVPKNNLAFFDPRTREASQTVVLSPELLARYQSGTAQVRATAIGRMQWTRTPPPVVRELSIEIQRG